MKLNITAALIFFASFTSIVHAQELKQPKPNWYNLDLKNDGMFGISMDIAYNVLLRGKKARSVIVAVIDDGLDVSHEDLKNVVWKNPKEIPGNGKDDDKNGYTDDINGWNFLGSAKESFEFDNDLIVIALRNYKLKFGDKDSTMISRKDLPAYRDYIKKQKQLDLKVKETKQQVNSYQKFLEDINSISNNIGKANPDKEDFVHFKPADSAQAKAKRVILNILQKENNFKAFLERTKEQLAEKKNDLQYHLNINYDPRSKYASEFSSARGRFYGNGNLFGNVTPAHGTHVAGVVGAERNNKIGINGVADCVQIMGIRAIPDGYGLDKDEANAIRYAVDNGANVINMSFGLSTATDRKAVLSAIKYALSKDVLFVQAAGNSHENLDTAGLYPDRANKADQKFIKSFIKVGASGFSDDDQLVVEFSNFGKKSVDVFAPGLMINSTVPPNGYEPHSGTSMAAPVVAGMAAVIRAYYPKLKAWQVKEIIIKSVIKRTSLQDLCVTGGIVNAFDALKLAANY